MFVFPTIPHPTVHDDRVQPVDTIRRAAGAIAMRSTLFPVDADRMARATGGTP